MEGDGEVDGLGHESPGQDCSAPATPEIDRATRLQQDTTEQREKWKQLSKIGVALVTRSNRSKNLLLQKFLERTLPQIGVIVELGLIRNGKSRLYYRGTHSVPHGVLLADCCSACLKIKEMRHRCGKCIEGDLKNLTLCAEKGSTQGKTSI